MIQSEHYNLKLVEGSDIVNPLNIDKPNYEAIDGVMYANECASIGTATELTTGTVHALTRSKENQNVFKFRATSNYTLGDTFTVDGGAVVAQYPDGSSLSDRCYIVGAEVLCSLNSGQLTLFINKEYTADNVAYGTSTVKAELDDINTELGNLDTAIDGVDDRVTALITKLTTPVNLGSAGIGTNIDITGKNYNQYAVTVMLTTTSPNLMFPITIDRGNLSTVERKFLLGSWATSGYGQQIVIAASTSYIRLDAVYYNGQPLQGMAQVFIAGKFKLD